VRAAASYSLVFARRPSWGILACLKEAGGMALGYSSPALIEAIEVDTKRADLVIYIS
jgi:hypothetical protein